MSVWELNNHGSFTFSSAWEEIKDKRIKNQLNSFLWNKNIPFKSSFLPWRTLRSKLPTNERLTIFGIEPWNRFCCLDRACMDNIEHTFNSGQFAAMVWSYFAWSAGLQPDHSIVQLRLQKWWTTMFKKCSPQTSSTSYTNIHLMKSVEEQVFLQVWR